MVLETVLKSLSNFIIHKIPSWFLNFQDNVSNCHGCLIALLYANAQTLYRVSQKKVWCSRLSMIDKTQQCDIFRLTKHNLCLVECEVSTPYVKRKLIKVCYDCERNDGSNMIKPCTTKKWILPGCFRKKYSVADYRYLKNGNTWQCNIFRHNKYNFYLDVCKI